MGIEPERRAATLPDERFVFVSYAREDMPFVRRLHDALGANGHACWVDWEGIPPTADWQQRIVDAIAAATSLVFVLSPDSVASEVCRQELEWAVEGGKRIVPVVRRPVDASGLPDALRRPNWLFADDDERFDAAADELVRALDTDLAWLEAHARVLTRAREWEADAEDRSLLLRGRELHNAEAWLARESEHRERATPLQARFVVASRAAATRRQRALLGSVAAALVVTAVLAVVALLQRSTAISERRTSVSRALAVASRSELARDPALGVALAGEAVRAKSTDEAVEALHVAFAAYRPVAAFAVPGRALSAEVRRQGDRLVIRASDGAAREYSISTGARLATIPSPFAGADVAYTADGGRLVTVDRRGGVRTWRSGTGKRIAAWPRDGGRVEKAVIDPAGEVVAVAGRDGRLELVSVRAGSVVHTPVPRVPGVARIVFSADGRLVATGGSGGTTHVWSVRTGNRVGSLSGEGQVLGVAVSGDDRELAAGTADGRTRVLDIASGRSTDFCCDAGAVTAAALSADGTLLATGSTDDTARVWDVGTGKLIRELRGFDGPLTDLAFVPGLAALATASGDGSVRVWALAAGTELEDLRGHTNWVGTVQPLAEGRTLLTTSFDGTARLWTPGGNRVLGTTGMLAPVVRYSPDGSRVAAADGFGGDALWDPRTGRLVRSLAGVTPSFSADGTIVATAEPAGLIGRVLVFDGRSGKVRAQLGKGSPDGAGVVAIRPDGHQFADVDRVGNVEVWEGNRAHVVAPWPTSTSSPTIDVAAIDQPFMLYAGDGRLVTTTLHARTVLVIDPDHPATKIVLHPSMAIWAFAASPTAGVVAVSAGQDVELWSTAGRRLQRLRGHSNIIPSLAFSADGRRLISGSADATARVWDAASGASIAVLRGNTDAVTSVGLSSDGRYAATLSLDGTARIWDASTGDELAETTIANALGAAIAIAPDGTEAVVAGAFGVQELMCPACQPTDVLDRRAAAIETRLAPDEQRVVAATRP